jgi:N-acetylmuramoyl-L-alanine amidase-like protein
MANRHGARTAARWGAALGMALALGVTGCASSSKRHEPSALMVAALPTPNFEGPELIEPKAPPAVAIKPPPVLLPPTHSITQGVPREWVPQAQANAWQWIVIHHSATTTGGAVAFDKIHRAKGWDELGYHFVIGNGTDTRDGQVEVGSRWPRQKWGAHAKTPDNRFNEFGIGVCLVGNFDISKPSDEQMKSLSKLVAFLMKTYHIPPERVVGHGDTGKATDCPGRLMNVAVVRQMSSRALADAGDTVPSAAQGTQTAAIELLHDANH